MVKELLKEKIIGYYKIINQNDSYDELYDLSLNALITKYIELYGLSFEKFNSYLSNVLNINNNILWEAEEFLNVLYNSEVLNPVDITIYFMNYYNALIDEKEKEYRITEEEIANAKNWAQKKDLEDDNNYTVQQITRLVSELEKIKKYYEVYVNLNNEEIKTRRM